MLSVGIDIGSINTKVVVIDQDTELVAHLVRPTGHKPRESGPATFEACLAEAGIERAAVGSVTATGYARHTVDFAVNSITEIKAAALGVRHWHPECRAIIDIGGQDSKVLVLDGSGRVSDFVMNDRCAAGTGNFLSVLAVKLQVPLEQFGPLALKSRKPVAISSLCVVMAESEILSLVAAEIAVEDIIAGLHEALARRVVNMAAPLDVRPEVVFTGGVAQDEGMRLALESRLEQSVATARHPFLAAALGAALSGSSQPSILA
jgi:predicted CoA-substrate-specific enzyme activase